MRGMKKISNKGRIRRDELKEKMKMKRAVKDMTISSGPFWIWSMRKELSYGSINILLTAIT